MKNQMTKPSRRMAELNDGNIVPYYIAVRQGEDITPDPEHYELIGEGTIYSIDGVRQMGEMQHRFYRKII